MRSINYKLEELIKIVCLVISFGGIILTITLFSTNSGDALVNLVFSKSLKDGFFFYGPTGPKWGATSPLQVLLFFPPYLFSSSPSIIIFKIINLLLFISTGILIFFIIKRVFNNNIISYLATAIWLGNPYLAYLTAALYDSILITFLITLYVLILLNFSHLVEKKEKIVFKRWIALGLIAGLLPLARPEGLLVSLIGFFYLFFLFKNKKSKYSLKEFIPSFILFCLIFSPYYLYLASTTNQFVPSSVLARGLMYFSNMTLSQILNFLMISWQHQIIFILLIMSILGMFFLGRFKDNLGLFFDLCLSLMIIFLSIFIVSKEPRYFSPVIPILTILSAISCYQIYLYFNRLKLTKYILVTLIFPVFVFIMGYGYLYVYKNIPRYSPELIFEKDMATFLNQVCKEEDIVLTYEIQDQYYLNCNTISLDGIVGGEILPYFGKHSDLMDFLQAYKPTFLITSRAFNYRKEYQKTVFYDLYLLDSQIDIGQSIPFGDITFIKLTYNTKVDVEGFNQWKSIYSIQYE